MNQDKSVNYYTTVLISKCVEGTVTLSLPKQAMSLDSEVLYKFSS